ncbi:MAG: hypothetical protein ACT4O1_16395 [Gemmatimonadota bacterium]
MQRILGLMTVAALAGCDLDLSGLGCAAERNFSDEISATTLNGLLVDAEDGELRIEGRSGINEIRVHATACSNDDRTTDDIDFQLFRSGGEARIITDVPRFDDARLDLVIEVPIDFDVSVYDTDGDIEIEDVFSVWLVDGSGHIDIRNIELDVIIDEDGSGNIDVDGVGGDFIVRRDGSGRIDYRNVQGRVDLP